MYGQHKNHEYSLYSRSVGANYKLNGFIELIVPDRAGLDTVTFSQAQALRRIGDVWVGVEHQRYFNKSGIRGLDESVNQLMVKWEF